MARQGPRRSREKESIQRRSDHRHPEGVRNRGGDRRAVPSSRDRAGMFLPVEEQVRGVGTERGKAAEAAGGRKPATEAHRGRTGGGHPGVEGGGRKKVVSPQAGREAVLVMQVEVELSQRRACGLMELYRATCRYQKRRSEDQPLRVRLRELAERRRRFPVIAVILNVVTPSRWTGGGVAALLARRLVQRPLDLSDQLRGPTSSVADRLSMT